MQKVLSTVYRFRQKLFILKMEICIIFYLIIKTFPCLVPIPTRFVFFSFNSNEHHIRKKSLPHEFSTILSSISLFPLPYSIQFYKLSIGIDPTIQQPIEHMGVRFNRKFGAGKWVKFSCQPNHKICLNLFILLNFGS